jgi:hypothetical protein
VLHQFSFVRFLPALDWISAARIFLLVAIARWADCLVLLQQVLSRSLLPLRFFPPGTNLFGLRFGCCWSACPVSVLAPRFGVLAARISHFSSALTLLELRSARLVFFWCRSFLHPLDLAAVCLCFEFRLECRLQGLIFR